MITLRPFGPKVTLTALASLSTPFKSADLASVSKLIIFADIIFLTPFLSLI